MGWADLEKGGAYRFQFPDKTARSETSHPTLGHGWLGVRDQWSECGESNSLGTSGMGPGCFSPSDGRFSSENPGVPELRVARKVSSDWL